MKAAADYGAQAQRQYFGDNPIEFDDDFLGEELSLGSWIDPTLSNAEANIVDDNSNGGTGSLQLIAAATGAWTSSLPQKPCGDLSAGGFWRLAWRVRWDNYSGWGNTSYAEFGFINAIGPEISFKATGPGGSLPKIYVSLNGLTGHTVNTNVTPSSSAYQNVVAEYRDSTLTVYVDGTSVYSNGSYTPPTVVTPIIRTSGVSVGDATLYVDAVRWRITRAP